MRFAVPLWLALLPVLLVAGGWLWWRCRRELHRRLDVFLSARLSAPLRQAGLLAAPRRTLLLLLLAAASLVFALARPLGGLAPEAATRQGVDILIALDGSRSMQAEDVSPSRFAVGQAGIDRLLEAMSGDRAGLLFFGGQPSFVAPLTFDTVSLRLVNRGLDPEWVGRGGTSLAAVIRRAGEFFRARPPGPRVLVLVSDGEETEDDAVLAAREANLQTGLHVFTFGTGTRTGGPIPLFERNARRELVRVGHVLDQQGHEVISKSDADLLRRVAEVSGGAYLDLAADSAQVGDFYRRHLQPLAAPLDAVPLTDYTEWFQLPLVLALLLLFAEARWPRQIPPAARVPQAAVLVATLIAGIGFAAGTPAARAAAADDAQRLMERRDFAGAFTKLQEALLAEPADLRARYNYAVAAYASGKYTTAIDAFGRLAQSLDREIEPLSRAQLGNSYFRSGEEMRPANPDGALVQWEKALASYQQAPEIPLAAANVRPVRAALLALLDELATARLNEGDAAARLAVEQGIPLWRESLRRLEQAQKHTEGDAETAALALRRAQVTDRIFGAFSQTGADKERRAKLQKAGALERAIDLMAGAAADYREALALRPDAADRREAKARAEAMLDPWRVELGDQRHAAAWRVRAVALEDAVALWQQAAGIYAQVLAHDPAQAGALTGRAKNDQALHDGLVELGDREQSRAGVEGLPKEERDPLLEQALDHYQAALAIAPNDSSTQTKLQQVGEKLTDLFVTRGQQELAEATRLAAEKPPEAIASAERAVESFGRALHFAPRHAAALAGRKEAAELLARLRNRDAEQQRKVLGDGKNLQDPKDLEAPGKLALKLLDLDNDHLASKKQQNFSAPENRPTKDW